MVVAGSHVVSPLCGCQPVIDMVKDASNMKTASACNNRYPVNQLLAVAGFKHPGPRSGPDGQAQADRATAKQGPLPSFPADDIRIQSSRHNRPHRWL